MTTTRPPSPGTARHAAGDGSFGRSVASAGGRGAILVLVAVVIGVILLQQTGGEDQAVMTDDGELVEVGQALGGGGVTTAPTTGGTTDPTGTTLPGETTVPTDATGSTVTTAPAADRASIVAIVYNAAGVNGIAGNQSDLFRTNGYQVLEPGTAPAQLAQTRIYARAGFEPSCQLVLTDLQANNPAVDLTAVTVATIDPATMPVTGYEQADCVVVVGQDMAVG